MSTSIAHAKLPAAWKKNKHHLCFDHDAVMMEQNPEQDAVSSNKPWTQPATLCIPKYKKGNSHMMKDLLYLPKNTEMVHF